MNFRTLTYFTTTLALVTGPACRQSDTTSSTAGSSEALTNAKVDEIEAFWANGQEGEFTGVGGVKIRYRSFFKEGQKAAVVISSGRTECMFKYDETIYELHRAGYSVYIHDHRGQGFSGTTTVKQKDPEHGHGVGHVNRFQEYVDDLHHFTTKIVKKSQLERTGSDTNLLLLAHSMGGCIASLYIEQHKRVFKAAVLCSPMHEPDVGLVPNIAVKTVAALRELKGQATSYAGTGGPYNKGRFDETTMKSSALTHSEKRYERIRKMFEKHKEARVGGASYGWVHQALNAADQARENAGGIEIDVLLLQATEDVAVTATGQELFAEKAGARCTLVRIKGAYHELLVESDEYRKTAMDKIRKFFSEAMDE